MYKAPHVRLWREANFEVQSVKNCRVRSTWKLRRWNSARRCGAKHISKSKCTKHTILRRAKHIWKSKVSKTDSLGPLSDVQMSLCVAGARDSAPSKKWEKREGFVAVSKTLAGVGHLKRICKDESRVAGAVQETHEADVLAGRWFPAKLHFGASDLQGCEDDFSRQVQNFVWPGITFSWQARYFRQMEWKNCKTHWYEPVSSAVNFPFLKEVSKNCFVFDLSSSEIEEVLQNCFVFEIVNFENWGSLAEELRRQACR